MDPLSIFDNNVISIDISSETITGSLDFSRFTHVKFLNCCNNQITKLTNLPNTLIKLNCSKNKIQKLNKLPNSLENLNCSQNEIEKLDKLPSSLIELSCEANLLTELDNLPSSLKIFQLL
jgi:hypothetical protein